MDSRHWPGHRPGRGHRHGRRHRRKRCYGYIIHVVLRTLYSVRDARRDAQDRLFVEKLQALANVSDAALLDALEVRSVHDTI